MNALTEIVVQPTTTVRWRDPILEELWALKRAINEESGFDLARLHVQACQAAQAWVAAGHGQLFAAKPSMPSVVEGGN